MFKVRGSGFGVRGSKIRHQNACSVFSFIQRRHILLSKSLAEGDGISRALVAHMGVKTFRDLRAWQAVREFKLGIYGLVEQGSLARDVKLREQLREAAASAQSQISEGFGRFDPLDFARFVKMARASLLECHNHLGDAVDRRHITDDTTREHHVRWEAAMKEIGGLWTTCSRQRPNATLSGFARTESSVAAVSETQNPEP
jgi:four helix bundle protein